MEVGRGLQEIQGGGTWAGGEKGRWEKTEGGGKGYTEEKVAWVEERKGGGTEA